MLADLAYYISEGLLTGIVNAGVIHVIALSGGGGGSTLHKTVMSMWAAMASSWRRTSWKRRLHRADRQESIPGVDGSSHEIRGWKPTGS